MTLETWVGTATTSLWTLTNSLGAWFNTVVFVGYEWLYWVVLILSGVLFCGGFLILILGICVAYLWNDSKENQTRSRAESNPVINIWLAEYRQSSSPVRRLLCNSYEKLKSP